MIESVISVIAFVALAALGVYDIAAGYLRARAAERSGK